jgi:hypothetical protein
VYKFFFFFIDDGGTSFTKMLFNFLVLDDIDLKDFYLRACFLLFREKCLEGEHLLDCPAKSESIGVKSIEFKCDFLFLDCNQIDSWLEEVDHLGVILDDVVVQQVRK